MATLPPFTTPPQTGAAPPGLMDMAKRLFSPKTPAPVAAPPKDPYQDREAMLKFYKDVKEECDDGRQIFERIWWRNILKNLGRQWIYYELGRNQWKDKRLAKWVPKPVTNKIAETHSAICSVFASTELGARVKPNGESPKDMATASLADNLEGPIGREHDIVERFGEADYWLVLTGNVFLHVWWDKNADSGVTTVPFEKCETCGNVSLPSDIASSGNICPNCQQQAFQPAVNEDGTPMQQDVSDGAGVTDVCSPLEVAGPTAYARADMWPYLIRRRWRTKGWWNRNHPELMKELRFEKSPVDRSLQLLKGIPSASEIGMSSDVLGSGGGEGQQEGMTEYELWAKPSKDYPKGLFLRVVGEGDQAKLLELKDQSTPGPLPYLTKLGKPIWPWVHIAYEQIGGRVWGRSPIDLIDQKQDQLNQLDSLTILIVNRVANPVWLEPKGAEVKKFTGEPGLVVKWQPMAGSNAKPERLEGANVPQSIFVLRQQLLDDIDNLAGTHDVLKGAKPAGVEAFSAMQLLVERSQSRFSKPLKNRGKGYSQWFSIALEMEREYGPLERIEAVMGPNGRWTFNHFNAADLQGSVQVIVEDGSTTPKTNLGKRAAIEQLRNFGVINPADPDQAHTILKTFGQTDLIPSLDVHVQAALQEQDEFEQWAASVQFEEPQPLMGPTGAFVVDPATGQPMVGPPQPTVPPPGTRKIWHNDQVHVSEHTKWLNGDNMRELMKANPAIEPYATMMLQQHQDAMAQAAMQQAMAEQQAAGGAKEAGGGANAMSSSNGESGNTADVPRGTGQRADNRGPE
jgi:hypothetical protein